jgi:PAS domain S-box-containing protein
MLRVRAHGNDRRQTATRRAVVMDEGRRPDEAGDFGLLSCEFASGRLCWSEESKALLGLACMQEPGMAELLALVHPEDHGRIAAVLARALADHACFDEECRILRPDGSLRWVQISGCPAPKLAGSADRLHILLLDIGRRKRIEAEHRHLIRQLIEAEENQRRRVARALHDSASQTLSALSLNLKALESWAGDRDHQSAVRNIQALAADLEEQLHAAACAAHPTAIDDIGWVAALDSLVADWTERSGIQMNFRSHGAADLLLTEGTQIALYRCVEAVLADIERHQEAMRVAICLQADARELRIVIEEFARAAPRLREGGHFGVGLAALRERLALIGADLAIETGDRSVRLFIQVRLDPERSE